MKYAQATKISIRDHPELSEKWVQDKIAEDPAILGLGDVILKDRERIQPRAGRLDLLLQDAEASTRYEVEVQLGKSDESHIIRAIEYWDIERKRYPQYDHIAVIIAEDITSRFLNIISLLNGMIPLIAIQMSAINVDDSVSLLFTTVIDQMQLGLVDDDEGESEPADRAYWERRGTPETVKMADQLHEIVHELDPHLDLKYNKFYIGLARGGQPKNFVIFRPQKNVLKLAMRLKRSEELENQLEEVGLDVMDYDARGGRYRIRLRKGEIQKHRDVLKMVFNKARAEFSA